MNWLHYYAGKAGSWSCQVQTLVRCLYVLRSPVTVQSSAIPRYESCNYVSLLGFNRDTIRGKGARFDRNRHKLLHSARRNTTDMGHDARDAQTETVF